MKTFKFFLSVMGISLISMISVSAQNYKAPAIDASGKVTDGNGKHLGWVTSEGIIKDSSGTKIASIDSEGNLVEAKTGKKLGKAQKNGNFVSAYAKTPDDNLKVSEPLNGSCEVKDNKGKTVMTVHENYKHMGACAYHCLSHPEMKMK